MVFLENFRIALAALRANTMRSILTALGIIIGVAAVIAVVSIVQGLQFMITKELQGVGATYMMVLPDMPQQGPGVVARQVKLTWEDGQAIEQQVPGIALVTPVVAGRQQVKYRDRKHDPGFILGVNENWQEVMNHTVGQGRFFSRIDLQNRRKVAVIGTEVVEELDLGQQPIGKEIYVGSLPATVIGVMEEKGQTLGEDLDDLVFIPFDSARRPLRPHRRRPGAAPHPGREPGGRRRASRTACAGCCDSATRSPRTSPTTSRSWCRTRSSTR